MALKILIAVLVIVAALFVFAAMKPNTIRIERSISVKAQPERVYALISDFHEWPKWAPQDREDSAMKRSYSGELSGVGALSEWSGAGNTGSGRMEITGVEPGRRVVVEVDFAKPFVAHNLNTFTLAPDDGGTRVAWAMEGTNVYMMKVMGVFTDMDKMMGEHFEAGLANLKAAAER
jgi:uncharacterized protein YndB with AHSA1/START domain